MFSTCCAFPESWDGGSNPTQPPSPCLSPPSFNSGCSGNSHRQTDRMASKGKERKGKRAHAGGTDGASDQLCHSHEALAWNRLDSPSSLSPLPFSNPD